MSSVGFREPLQPVVLENEFVRLEPLRLDHAADLAALTVGTGITRWFPEPLETRAIVDKAYDRVRGLITDRKPVLLSAAAELKAKETLEGDRLRRLLAGDPAEETR